MKLKEIIDTERKIIIAMITNTKYLKQAVNLVDQKYIQSKEAKILISWIYEYFNKYKKAPKNNIQHIYMEKLKSKKIQDNQAPIIEEILDNLSKESTHNKINIPYLIDITETYCKACQLRYYAEQIEDEVNNGNILEAEHLLSNFKPIENIKSNAVTPLGSVKQIRDSFESFGKPLIRYPGALGQMINHYMVPESFVCVLAQNKGKKALKNNTPVLTNKGWKNICNIKIGDTIFGKNGQKEKVLKIHPQGKQECYRFIFNDKTWIDSDEGHSWTLQTYYQRYQKKNRNKSNPQYKTWIDLTTEQIVRKYGVGKLTKPAYRPLFPKNKSVQFTKKKLPINPYILGLLLGDGCFRSTRPSICNPDNQIIKSIKNKGYKINKNGALQYDFKIKPENVIVKDHIDKNNKFVKGFVKCIKIPEEKYRLKTHLKKLNLWNKKSIHKHIPKKYLFNSIENRLEILKGLMDTDGYLDERGHIGFTSSSKKLANNIAFLIRSLGGKVTITSKIPKFTHKNEIRKRQRAYTLFIKINTKIFKLKRKLKQQRLFKRTNNKILYEIKKTGKHNTTCITTTAKDGLFITKDFIVTHNSFFLMDAAIRAAKQGKNVTIFQAGDMSQEQMERRQGIYLAKKSDLKQYCNELYIPILDCVHNQIGDCEFDFIEAENDPPFDGMDLKKVREDITAFELKEAFEDYTDHIPCYNCLRNKKRGKFFGTIWYKKRQPVEPLIWKDVYQLLKKKHKSVYNRIKLITYSSGTLTMNKIKAEKDLLEKSGFFSEIDIVDYFDLLGADRDTLGMALRDQINIKWQRGRSFSQDKRSLLLTASQSDADGFNKRFLDKNNFNNDRRILDHITAMFGINMSIEEKKKGISRINDIAARDMEGASFVYVFHRLQIGRPILGSFY